MRLCIDCEHYRPLTMVHHSTCMARARRDAPSMVDGSSGGWIGTECPAVMRKHGECGPEGRLFRPLPEYSLARIKNRDSSPAIIAAMVGSIFFIVLFAIFAAVKL